MKNKRNTTPNVTMQTWKIRRVYWGLNEPNYAFERYSQDRQGLWGSK